jgi:hypothetical protein
MRAVRTVGSRGARQRAANPPPSAARRADGHVMASSRVPAMAPLTGM